MTIIDANVSVSTVQNVTVVNVTGELDDFQAPKLHSIFQADDTEGRPMIINLTGTTFVDSVGLGVIVAQAKRARKSGVSMALIVTTPQVNRLITQSGIAQSKHLDLAVYESLADGLKAMTSAA